MSKQKTLRSDDCFHPDTKEPGVVVGFYWVEGDPVTPLYCVTLLGRDRFDIPMTIECEAATAKGLHDWMTEQGFDPPPLSEIARLCESAERSQSIVRHREYETALR